MAKYKTYVKKSKSKQEVLMKVPLRVLIIEDSERDAELIIRQLKKPQYSVQHERFETAKDMKAALENQIWDIVISDYRLPRFNAPAALALLQKTKLDIPFIAVSGTIGEEAVVELMKLGANDYLMKDKLVRLIPIVKRELAKAQVRQEHKQSEEILRNREAQLSMIYNNVNDAIFTIAVELKDRFRFTSVNRRFLELIGLSANKVIGKLVQDIIPKSANTLVLKKCKEAIRTGQSVHWEEISKSPIGENIGEVTIAPIYNVKGICTQLIGTVHDIAERKQAEKELQESEIHYRFLFEQNPAPMLIYEKGTLQLLAVNEAFIQRYGYSQQEVLSMRLPDLYPDEEKGPITELAARLHGHACAGEWHHRTRDGSLIDIEAFSHELVYQDHNARVAVLIDITERKQVEKALRESQTLYQSFVQHIPAGVFRKDSEGRYIFVNSYFCQLKELKADEILGKTSHELAAYESAKENSRTPKMMGTCRTLEEQGTDHHKLIMLTGKPIELEEIYPQLDGTTRFFQVVKSPVFTSDGKIIGTQGVQFDITERKKAEVELKESEERYRRLIEFSPEAIAVYSEGKIIFVNPAAITLLGAHNATELIDKPFLDIIHPDHRNSIHQQIIAVMKEDYALPLTEQKFIRLDGSVVEVEVAALQIVYKEKPAMQIVVRDISEQKRLQNQLLQTQKIQSIGTLAGGIAHDFNKILGNILAYSSLLGKNKLNPDKFSVSITAINQAVQRGAALVRQILTFARKTDVVFEPMDISEMIHELLSMLEQTFPKTIIFSESIANSLPFIFADRTQVHQALLNLCINARDAMPHGGTISITAEKQTKEQMAQQFPAANEDAYVCLTVTDTGKGMDEATRLRVFDPFFTTKEKGKGTGLGLSVVYGVVQAHRGLIDLKSEPGHGTTFRLFFPVPTMNKQAADAQQPLQSYEIGGTETILLVEDEELLIEMVSFLLESKGYTVLCARNGLEAVNLYQANKQKIALVITDMGLPVMTGTDEFKKLKEINPNVKVVFASGYFELDIKSELLKDGANGFIQKPYEPDNILRVIRQVIDQKE